MLLKNGKDNENDIERATEKRQARPAGKREVWSQGATCKGSRHIELASKCEER